MLARIQGIAFIAPIDDISNFADMYARIEATRNDLQSLGVEFVNRRGEERESTVLTETLSKEMSGADFAMGASVPNVFFHLNMVYAILRREGVELGKWDYISGFMGPLLED